MPLSVIPLFHFLILIALPSIKDHPCMEPVTFEITDIINVIDKHKFSFSSGDGCINSRLLKNTKYVSSLFLRDIFHQSLSSDSLHSNWKCGRVIQIRKSDDRKSSNYRPYRLPAFCLKLWNVSCLIVQLTTWIPIIHCIRTSMDSGEATIVRHDKFISYVTFNLI